MNQASTIEALFDHEPTLATPPEVYFEVIRALNDPAANYDHIAAILEKDPSLTARLLKLANSSMYYPSNRMNSVSSAIGFIGLGPLSDLVLASVIKNRFDALFEGGPSLFDFWLRSIRCGVIAHEIERFIDAIPFESPAFTCGLLLDIGELVIAAAAPDLARQVKVRSEPGAPPVHAAETAVLGFNRYDVGQELARRWQFPPLIGESMQAVVEPSDPPMVSEPARWIDVAHQLALIDTAHQDCLHEIFPVGFTVGDQCLSIDDFIDDLTPGIDTRFGEIFYLFYN